MEGFYAAASLNFLLRLVPALWELRGENYALIENLTMEFASG